MRERCTTVEQTFCGKPIEEILREGYTETNRKPLGGLFHFEKEIIMKDVLNGLKGRPLDHIGLACSDVEANVKWYQDVLGYQVIWKGKSATTGRNVYFIKSGYNVYEMYQPNNLPEAVQGKIDHIAFVSYDIEADYQFALDAGYQICTNGIEGAEGRFTKRGVKWFKILSPTGEQVEFQQILPDED